MQVGFDLLLFLGRDALAGGGVVGRLLMGLALYEAVPGGRPAPSLAPPDVIAAPYFDIPRSKRLNRHDLF